VDQGTLTENLTLKDAGTQAENYGQPAIVNKLGYDAHKQAQDVTPRLNGKPPRKQKSPN
jgi:hypothetical protein